MDKLDCYSGSAWSLYMLNEESLKKKYGVRFTEDEIILLYKLGHYLSDPEKKSLNTSDIHKDTSEVVRKLPKAPRNANYYYNQSSILLEKVEEEEGTGEESEESTVIKKTSGYCVAFSTPSNSWISAGKISDVIGYDFTDFYQFNEPGDEKSMQVILIEPRWKFKVKEFTEGGRHVYSDMSVIAKREEKDHIEPLFNWAVKNLRETDDISNINEYCEILIDSVEEENIPEVYEHLEKEDAVKALREKIGMWDIIENKEEKRTFQIHIFSCIRDVLLKTSRETRKKCFQTRFTETNAFKTLSDGFDEKDDDSEDENIKSTSTKMKEVFIDIVDGLLKEFIHDSDYDELISNCGEISTFVKLAREGKEYGTKALYIIYSYIKIKEKIDGIKEKILSILKDYRQDIKYVMPCLNILDYFSPVQTEDRFTVKVIKGDDTMENLCNHIGACSEPIEEQFAPFEKDDFGERMLKKSIDEFFDEEKAAKIRGELASGKIRWALSDAMNDSFLNLAEVMVIYIYMSGSGYYEQINKYIREHEDTPIDKDFIKYFFKAIRRLPLKLFRNLYRGQLGKYSSKGMVSTSRDIDIAKRFAKKAQSDPHIICFNNFLGYDLSFISTTEKEIVTEPSMLSKSLSDSILIEGKIKVKDIEMDGSISNTKKFPPGPYDNFTYSVVRALQDCLGNGHMRFAERRNIERILNGAIRKEEKVMFRRFGGFDKIFAILGKNFQKEFNLKTPDKEMAIKKNALIILNAFIKDDVTNMHIIKKRFLDWIYNATDYEFEYAREIFNIFYIAPKISDEETNRLFSKLVDEKFYKKEEWLDLRWKFGIKSVPNALKYLQKMIKNMKEEYEYETRGDGFLNALKLVNELGSICEKERDPEIYSDAFEFISRVLDAKKDDMNVVLNALHGLNNFMHKENKKGPVKNSLDTLIQLIDKYKDSPHIFELILNVVSIILDPGSSHEYMSRFIEQGGLEALFGAGKDDYLAKNDNFILILSFIASNDGYFEKYKEPLCKYAKMIQENKHQADEVVLLSNLVSRNGANNFNKLEKCTLGFNGCQPFYICLDCNSGLSDQTFCKYCFETHHKGHKYIKMFGKINCDQKDKSSLQEPPNKQPKLQE